MPSLEVFVKNVRSLMAQRDVKLKDLSEKIGVSEPYLSLVLNGTKTNLSDEYKDRIASFFNVSMARLYSEDDTESSLCDETWTEDYERTRLKESLELFIRHAHLESLRLPFFSAFSILSDQDASIVNRFFSHVMREAVKDSRLKAEPSIDLFSLDPKEKAFLLVSTFAGQDGQLRWVQDALAIESQEFSLMVKHLMTLGYVSVVEDSGGVERVRCWRDFSQSAPSFFSLDKIRAFHLSLASAMETHPDDGPFFLFRLAQQENLGGLPQKALKNLEKASSLFESQGLFREAIRSWVESGVSHGLVGNHLEKARCLYLASQCASRSQDLETADELGAKSMAILRQLDAKEMAANTCLMLGNNWAAKDQERSIKWYELGLKTAPDRSPIYGRLLVNLASRYMDLGRSDKAESVMDKAQRWVGGQHQEDIGELKPHMDLIAGLVQYKRRNWAYARRLFLSCLEAPLKDALDDTAVAHHNLGMIAYMEDNMGESIKHLRLALELYNELNASLYWASGAVELAKAYLRSQDLDSAKDLITKCSTDPVRSFLGDKAWFYLTKAAIDEADRNHEEAIRNGKTAVEIFGRDGASQRDLACACLWLAQVLETQGRIQAAKPFRARAFRIYERRRWNVKELHRDVALLTPKAKDSEKPTSPLKPKD